MEVEWFVLVSATFAFVVRQLFDSGQRQPFVPRVVGLGLEPVALSSTAADYVDAVASSASEGDWGSSAFVDACQSYPFSSAPVVLG